MEAIIRRLPLSVQTWRNGQFVALRAVPANGYLLQLLADPASDARLLVRIDRQVARVVNTLEINGAIGFLGVDSRRSTILAARNLGQEEVVLYAAKTNR